MMPSQVDSSILASIENDSETVTHEIKKEEELIAKQNYVDEEILRKKIEKQKEEREAVELRYERLMHLLNKSQFYSQFLLEKIKKGQKENPKKKLKKCSDKENSTSVLNSNSENFQSQNSSCRCNSKRTTDKRKSTIVSKQVLCTHNSISENTINDELLIRENQPRLFENGEMRPYQLDGFTWLKIMYEHGVNGILADEMGLGKTIQVIAIISHLIDKGVPGPFLVVAPLSTLPNWMSEFKRFAPQIPTILYHGPELDRAQMRSKFLKKHVVGSCQSGAFPVVVTSYEVTIRDQKLLSNIMWRYLVVDEGHRIKNHKCQLARCLRSFKTINRLLLTGTPLQNNLAELWSLLNFLLPEIFDSLDAFESWFEIGDMMEDGADEKIVQQEREKQIVGTLRKILSPFLLRRVKADIDLDIPAKKELLVYTPMTPFQVELYKATLTKDHSLFVEDTKHFESQKIDYDSNGRPMRSSKKVIDYATYFDDSENDSVLEKFLLQAVINGTKEEKTKKTVARSCVLNLTWRNRMMQCRKIVNHPYLLRYPLTSEGEFKIDQDLLKYCGKLQVLDQLLKELKNRGHKVLIFSQMAKLLDIIEDYLTMRPEFRYKRLDGSVSLDDRRTDIDEFNNSDEYFLYLLTTRAGGLGINLTSADTVIIYDSDWNPQQDLQAQDRCHRIGQTKPVLILRFITASTIDQRIVERAATKRKLEKMIMKKGQFTLSLLKERELQEIVNPDELLKLLQQRDHLRIHKASMGDGIYTSEEIEQLLNRSDLVHGSQSQTSANVTHLEGVFKVLPEQDSNNSSLS